jgi:hypothetical protein
MRILGRAAHLLGHLLYIDGNKNKKTHYYNIDWLTPFFTMTYISNSARHGVFPPKNGNTLPFRKVWFF